MYAKSKSPIRSKSPQKTSKQYLDARAKRTSDRPRKQRPEQPQPQQSKTALVVMGIFFLMFVSSTVYSFTRSKTSEREKPQRYQIAGLDIPREVIERMQKLRNAEDKERVLLEWAHSQGITFEDRKDGSYVALRDGYEYILRAADPDFDPDAEQPLDEPAFEPKEPVDEDEFVEPSDDVENQ